MFTAALFTIARTWKQLKFPSTEECIKKIRYIYTKEYYSANTNGQNNAIAAMWMYLEIVILSEVSQKKANISGYNLHVEPKNDINELIYKTKINSQI